MTEERKWCEGCTFLAQNKTDVTRILLKIKLKERNMAKTMMACIRDESKTEKENKSGRT